VATAAACSMCPSSVKLLAGSDGVMLRDVRKDASQTHFQLVWGPGSGQEENQGSEGWTGAESGSLLGSWSEQPVAGVEDEGARGRGAALGELLVEADHEHSSAHMLHSCGKHVLD